MADPQVQLKFNLPKAGRNKQLLDLAWLWPGCHVYPLAKHQKKQTRCYDILWYDAGHLGKMTWKKPIESHKKCLSRAKHSFSMAKNKQQHHDGTFLTNLLRIVLFFSPEAICIQQNWKQTEETTKTESTPLNQSNSKGFSNINHQEINKNKQKETKPLLNKTRAHNMFFSITKLPMFQWLRHPKLL